MNTAAGNQPLSHEEQRAFNISQRTKADAQRLAREAREQPSPSQNPVLNRAIINTHLAALFPPDRVLPHPDGWIEIAFTDRAERVPNRAQCFPAHDLKAPGDFAESMNRQGFNVYVGASIRHGAYSESGRSSKIHFLDAFHGWVDYEAAGADERIRALLVEHKLRPLMVVTTGTIPVPRRHLYFKLDGPIALAQIEAVNTALCVLLDSDKSVVDCCHLMRLAGCVSYPSPDKVTRGYIPEMVALRVNQDAPAYKAEVFLGLNGKAPGDTTNSQQNNQSGPKTDDELVALLKSSQVSGQWHNAMRNAVAVMVGRGWNNLQINMTCGPYCNAEYGDADLKALIESARKKFNKPNPEPGDASAEPAWGEPLELPNDLPKVDAFDPAFLPDKLAAWVGDISDRLQCPPDYVAVAAVTVLGSVIGRRVGIKPQVKTDWVEVPNLWGVIIGRPGMLKSPAMSEALKPIHHLEAEASKANIAAQEQFAADSEEWTMRKQVKAQLFKEELKKKSSDASAAEPKCDFGKEPKEPTAVRFRTNDSSYEAIGELLIANPAGILVERDELVSLLRQLDTEQQAVARGFYLSGWSGMQPYTFDRIIRGHRHIDAVCISVLGNTQPSRILEYARRANADGGGGDGLLQRFGLMVWPDTPAEWRNVDEYPNKAARDGVFDIITKLSKMTEQDAFKRGAAKGPYDKMPFFRFDEAAGAEFLTWRSQLEGRLRSGELSVVLEGHLAKYRKLVPSLALINHLVDGESGDVGLSSLLKALAFATYLESHARRVYGASNQVDVAAGAAILSRIRRGDLHDGFTAREIHRKDWSGLTDRDHIHAGLDLLVDCHHIAARYEPSPIQGGR